MMFIKWVKELTHEWWEQWSGLLQMLYIGYLILCVTFCVSDLLTTSSNDVMKGWYVVHQYVIPIFWVTGILPLLAWLGWKLAFKVYGLYIDYQYFAANGGKRKRDEER